MQQRPYTVEKKQHRTETITLATMWLKQWEE